MLVIVSINRIATDFHRVSEGKDIEILNTMQIFRYLFYILGQNNAYFLRFGIFLLKLFVNFLLRKGKNRTFAAVL